MITLLDTDTVKFRCGEILLPCSLCKDHLMKKINEEDDSLTSI